MNETVAPPVTCTPVPASRHIPSLAEDVRNGLLGEEMTLPPKYFYDERGSHLFDRICDEPEYYPTRTEDALLARSAAEIMTTTRPQRILELGSGTSRKTRRLLDACNDIGLRPVYAPFDVCDEILLHASEGLTSEYPWLRIDALAGDYTAGLDGVPAGASPQLVVFLGGTVGNFDERGADIILADIRALMQRGDWLLIGVDRVKEPEVLHAAYNDSAGITADFNQNLLAVLNRELTADFDVDSFAHYSIFNPRASQIEMYLVAMRDMRIRLQALDESLEVEEGDAILTEISRKYTRTGAEAMLEHAGFAVQRHFEADGGAYSLLLAQVAD